MKSKITIDRGKVRIIVKRDEEQMEIDFKYLRMKLWIFEEWEFFLNHRYIIKFDRNVNNPTIPRHIRLEYLWGNKHLQIWHPDYFDLVKWIDTILDKLLVEVQTRIDNQEAVKKHFKDLHK